MATTETVTVRMSRGDSQTAWGFRLHGGKEFNKMLCIERVTPGSLADRAGLRDGDQVDQIAGRKGDNMQHKEAQQAIVASGNNLDIVVHRGATKVWRPNITPAESHHYEYSSSTTATSGGHHHGRGGGGGGGGGGIDHGHGGVKVSLKHHDQTITGSGIGSGHNVAPKPFYSSQGHHSPGSGPRGGLSTVSADLRNHLPAEAPPPPPQQSSPRTAEGGSSGVQHLQYNSPAAIYSQDSKSEAYLQQTGGCFGTDPKASKPEPAPWMQSQTLKAVLEDEASGSKPSFTGDYHTALHHSTAEEQSDSFRRLTHALDAEDHHHRHVDAPSMNHHVDHHHHAGGGGAPVCDECGKSIIGMFAKAGGMTFHAECYKCATCGSSLKNIGYQLINNKLYCDIHANQVQSIKYGGPPVDPKVFAPPAAPILPARSPQEDVSHAGYQPEVMRKGPARPHVHTTIDPHSRGVPTRQVTGKEHTIILGQHDTSASDYSSGAPHHYGRSGAAPYGQHSPQKQIYSSHTTTTQQKYSPQHSPASRPVESGPRYSSVWPPADTSRIIPYWNISLHKSAQEPIPDFPRHRSGRPYLLNVRPNKDATEGLEKMTTYGAGGELLVYFYDEKTDKTYDKHGMEIEVFTIARKRAGSARAAKPKYSYPSNIKNTDVAESTSPQPIVSDSGIITPSEYRSVKQFSMQSLFEFDSDFEKSQTSRSIPPKISLLDRATVRHSSDDDSYEQKNREIRLKSAMKSDAASRPSDISLSCESKQLENQSMGFDYRSHGSQSTSLISNSIQVAKSAMAKQDYSTSVFSSANLSAKHSLHEFKSTNQTTSHKDIMWSSENQLYNSSAADAAQSSNSNNRPDSYIDPRSIPKKPARHIALTQTTQLTLAQNLLSSTIEKLRGEINRSSQDMQDRKSSSREKNQQSTVSGISVSNIGGTHYSSTTSRTTTQHMSGGPDMAKGRASSDIGTKITGARQPRRGKGILQQLHEGPRIPVCESCYKEIRGPFVLAMDKSWCPDHFVCNNGKCQRKLLDIGFVEEQGNIYCEYCFEQYFAPKCSRCSKSIVGDTLHALNQNWHPSCFTCAHCHQPFGNSSFFLEDGKAYCETDWNKLFTVKCVGCQFPIEAGDRWVEAIGHAYHSNCFVCTLCQKNLEGVSFYAKGGKPYCKAHA